MLSTPKPTCTRRFQLLSRTRVASHNLMNSKRRNPFVSITPSKQVPPLPYQTPSFLSPFRWKNWEKFSKNFTRLRLDSTDLNTTIGVDCKSEGNSFDEIAGGEKELIPSRIRGRPGKSVEPIGLAFGSNRKLPATN